MSDETKLICTNGDLWLATQPAEVGQKSALQAVLKVPMSVLAVRNGSALTRAVESALKDIDAARIALCEAHGTKAEDGANYTITDVAGWNAGWNTLMAESVTLAGVKPLSVKDFAQGSYVSAEDVMRCGPLLTD